MYTVKNSSLASRWDSNQALKKSTGTAHPSHTKWPQCHAAQTFRNHQNIVDFSEFSMVAFYVISGERHKKTDLCAQEIKLNFMRFFYEFSCLVI